MPRLANRKVAPLVRRCEPFKANSIFAEQHTTYHSKIYVVYSYGTHFPMYIAETAEDGQVCWYFNTDRYSLTTARHKRVADPGTTATPMTTEQMWLLARGGIADLFKHGYPA